MITSLYIESIEASEGQRTGMVADVDVGDLLIRGVRLQTEQLPKEGVVEVVGYELTLPDGIRINPGGDAVDDFASDLQWVLSCDSRVGERWSRQTQRRDLTCDSPRPDWGGHDPLPSYLWKFRDTDATPAEIIATFGPAGPDPYAGDRVDDTCYSPCPACEPECLPSPRAHARAIPLTVA